ncbi:MAG: ATP synthase F1 subunit delta [Solirubrobacterales bacterium]
MEEIGRVYGDALFDVAKQESKLDAIHDELGEFVDAMDSNRDLQVFMFSPYFSSSEKREGLSKVISGAEPELVNFLELLAEKHRMPAIFHMRRRFDKRWAEENRQLDVTLTSAVELDDAVVKRVGKEIERQTDRTINLTREVDPEVLGGLVLRVGNRVLDASIRTKLDKLRKEVAKAA